MNEFDGKVAVVTGAASGIGLALARRFAEEGMKVVLADIEAEPLEAAQAAIRATGATTIAVRMNVMHDAEVKRLADTVFETWGNVHILCNNAGVGGGAGADGLWNVPDEDWAWVLGVNFSGVLHGIRHFVPRMLEKGEAGHIVNTASVAGLVTGGTGAPYTISKHGVVALSELLYKDFKARNAKLSASVLCPGWVDTRIIDSVRNRPQELKPAADAVMTPQMLVRLQAVRAFLKNGFQPEAIAGMVFDAIRSDTFYIVAAQPNIADAVALRLEDIRLRRNPTITPPL
ncbi:MAG TPA: SDR family NAD(P)-dependent oxidoreductase [Burkholderiales bacterium]|jgi:NAD(P)-dependent dehydrogenase (short-subunit alcohol dehydrogenase family)|nr:SDR family NAD(P)-dependent oxidoreductase [Burkholderiales bacterium]